MRHARRNSAPPSRSRAIAALAALLLTSGLGVTAASAVPEDLGSSQAPVVDPPAESSFTDAGAEVTSGLQGAPDVQGQEQVVTGEEGSVETGSVETDAPSFSSSGDNAEAEASRLAIDAVGSDAIITPLASSTTMDVVVTKRTFADPRGTNTPQIGTDTNVTAGASFRLYRSAGVNAAVGASTEYTCTITVASPGSCTIVVPLANGGNQGQQFWVVEETPATGTYSNPLLKVGSYQGPAWNRAVVGLTPRTAANTTIQMPLNTATSTNALYPTNVSAAMGASYGAVANSLNNPTVPLTCDIAGKPRIALVLDESASIETGDWTTFRNAIVASGGLLDTLASTNASVAILGFGTTINWHTANTGAPLTVADNRTALANSIPTARPGGAQNATNWSAALRTLASLPQQYEIVIFVTDGAPNYVYNGSNPAGQPDGFNVTTRSIESAIYASNAIKNKGTRVIAVGVGAGITGAGQNLRAVSGATVNTDYFQTSNWDLLKKELGDIAAGVTCQVPIEVSKTTVSAGGVTTTDAAGWTFAAAKATGTPAAVSVVGTAAQTTTAGATGRAGWTVRFTQPAGQTASIVLTETPKTGWNLTSAVCNGVPAVVADNTVTIAGLQASSTKVSCVFTNTETPTPASLTWSKVNDQVPAGLLGGSEWTVTGPGFPAPGTVVVDCVTASCTGLDKDSAAGKFQLDGLAWGSYTVTESKAPAGYQLGTPAASFTVVVDATTAGTTIVKGPFENKRLPGSVTWSKVDDGGALLGGSEWLLTGPGLEPTGSVVTDCIAASAPECTGLDKDPEPGKFKIEELLWGTFELVETKAPAGYQLRTDVYTFTIGADALTVDLEPITNEQREGPALPLTGGLGADGFALVGGGLLAAAAAALLFMRRRRAES